MALTGFPRKRRLPSATGILSRLAFAHAERQGLDLDPLLKRADITRQQIANRELRIPAHDQLRFVNLVADTLGDDCLGFHLALNLDPRAAGLVYYVLASSDTLLEGLERASRYTAMVNEGVVQTLKDGRQLRVAYRYFGISRHLDRHQMEFWLTALVKVVRQVTGLRVVPSRVRIAHARSVCPAEFAEFFGGEIEFGASVDEVVFDKRVGDLPIVGADPHLNRLLLKYGEQVLIHGPRSRATFRAGVENAIVPLLPHGKARADMIARELGLSARTLARRLEAEGQTFSGVMQGVREDLARRYLAERQLSISQIAWLLGYREVGAFSHAFKRMTGKTPREFRVTMD